jgi:hypothetical protein
MNRTSCLAAAISPVLMLLAACGGGSEQPAVNASANESSPAPKPAAAAPVPSLAGTWAVTKINGAAPRQVWPMTATFAPDAFTIQSECRRFVWKYRQQGNIVEFTSPAVRDCSRMRSPDETQIEDPVTLANIAMFSDDGREVQITGPGGRITLTKR